MSTAGVARLLECPRVGRGLLAIWFAAMLALGASLLAKHVVALRAPPGDARLGAALGALRRPEDRGRFLAVHVLYSDRGCSRRVAEHLIEAPRPKQYAEMVLWVGDDPPPPALAEHGFFVKRTTNAELERYGIHAAPMLVALHPSNQVRYAGGYSTRKQGAVLEDLAILAAARTSDRVESLPVFGCAESARLTAELSVLSSP